MYMRMYIHAAALLVSNYAYCTVVKHVVPYTETAHIRFNPVDSSCTRCSKLAIRRDDVINHTYIITVTRGRAVMAAALCARTSDVLPEVSLTAEQHYAVRRHT